MNKFNNNNLMGVVYLFSGDCGVYPGATTRPKLREQEHKAALRNGRHWNGQFQEAVNHCGLLSFAYIRREPVPFEKLGQEEQKLYDEARNAGVPLLSKRRPAGRAHGVGYKLSKTTRRKQSRAKKGNKHAAKYFVFVAPDNKIHETFCLSDLCDQYQLDITCMSRVAHAKQESHRGWRKAPS
jgi:hypothetical protein